MDPSYQNEYSCKKINPHKLVAKITAKYSNYNLKKQYTFQQLLFILDQECMFQKCDRDIVRQLFQQSATPQNKSSLNDIIYKYVENLQTSKICLIRQENSVNKINQRLNQLKGNKRSYVYLKLIQATVHARFSSIPSLSYKIQPSNIPPITIINSLSPLIGHEYTLQMETNSFKIIFYESGVSIFQWEWPDEPQSEKEGQYHRKVLGQSLSFQIILKYAPINSNPERKPLELELESKIFQKENQKKAFSKLCNFEPFIENKKKKNILHGDDDSLSKRFTNTIIQCLPFMQDHTRNLYYMMILLLIVQCLASISWGMEFLDIILIFGIIAKLYEQEDQDLGMQLWMTLMGFALLIVKSIWGAVLDSLMGPKLVIFLIIAIVIKVICLFFIWFSAVRKQEVLTQRKETFYDGVNPQLQSYHKMEEEEQDNSSTIWM